ncbi:MAG: restriction endonuclease subunit S [Methylococcales bacterium]
MGNLISSKLGYVTNNFDNIRVPLSVKQREKLDKKYRYYGAQGVIDYVDDYLFDGEYILVAEDGENLKSQKNNICNYVTGKFWVNNHAHIINASNGNDTKYLFYKLNLVNFRGYVTGSAQPKLTKDNLNSIVLHIHNPDEQIKIAAVLSALDAKIELNNRINHELEAMAKTLYDYWFVQFDFPDKNDNPYKSSGGKMVYNEELKRDIPDGWFDGSLLDLGEIVGGSTPSTSEPDNFNNNGTPWITPKDLSNNTNCKYISRGDISVTTRGLKEASLKVMPAGTVLLSTRAPIGYMAIARNSVTTNQGFKSFVPSKGFESSFIFYAVKNSLKTIVQYSSGSTFKEISTSVLKTIKVCLPPNEIANDFTERTSAIFKRQDLLEQENQQLTQLRDWLLPMLMNGQVRLS